MAHEILHEIERLIFIRVNKPVTILFPAKTRNKSISGKTPGQGMYRVTKVSWIRARHLQYDTRRRSPVYADISAFQFFFEKMLYLSSMHECLVRLCSSIWMHAFFQSLYEAVFLLQEMFLRTYPVSAKCPCSSTLVNKKTTRNCMHTVLVNACLLLERARMCAGG